ncbi:hypothetical protein H109_05210 [Trichophyton interdigitale MR816]|uniref:RING-type domain-containing protein n=1 Tax=Trichophyton interdigitale (strain MR816) TaxID=1215338 RepID=A0A059J4S2_TRIIM|nr:hypothetical protein H101_00745 [Trichophyton interdigitale H6]KDB22876.1 hypothetical protein H109_05210 [Trichophyton interdigitale MR816]
MASYEVEHPTTSENSSSTNNSRQTSSRRPARPDLSTFFATLNEISPNQGNERTRPYAVPVPGDVSAAFRSLAEAFDVMRRSGDNAPLPVYDGRDPEMPDAGQGQLIEEMIRALLQDAEAPPREVEGVSEEFCDVLDRVPKTRLKESQTCPICNNPFLEDSHPLVVRLPCHTSHMFDLECVRPWLRLRGTCPLDRTDFGKKERQKEQDRIEKLMKKNNGLDNNDEEEEWDGMYA